MPHYLVFFPPDLDKQYDSPWSAGGCQRRSDSSHRQCLWSPPPRAERPRGVTKGPLPCAQAHAALVRVPGTHVPPASPILAALPSRLIDGAAELYIYPTMALCSVRSSWEHCKHCEMSAGVWALLATAEDLE